MKVYRLLRPVHKPVDQVFYRLTFELIRFIQAPTPEDAVALAKRLGYNAPVVERAEEEIQ